LVVAAIEIAAALGPEQSDHCARLIESLEPF